MSAGGQAPVAAVHRHRQLQAGQRPPRPRCRRCPAAPVRPARPDAAGTASPAASAHLFGVRPAVRRRIRHPPAERCRARPRRTVRRAARPVPRRIPHGGAHLPGQPQHRHRLLSGRCRLHHPAAHPRRHRHVPGQGRRQVHGGGIQQRAGTAQRANPPDRGPAARTGRRQPAAAGLHAGTQPRRCGGQLRSAAALAFTGAGHGLARRVHPHCRACRAVPEDRQLGHRPRTGRVPAAGAAVRRAGDPAINVSSAQLADDRICRYLAERAAHHGVARAGSRSS